VLCLCIFVLQLDETPLNAAADSEVTLDAVAAAARDIERIQTYIANMAAMANEVLEFAGPESDEEADGGLQQDASMTVVLMTISGTRHLKRSSVKHTMSLLGVCGGLCAFHCMWRTWLSGMGVQHHSPDLILSFLALSFWLFLYRR
jgi:hypothetical protein